MNYMMSDSKLLMQFQKERRLKLKTLESYKNTKSMVELLEEAEAEEEQQIRWVKRKLRQHLIN